MGQGVLSYPACLLFPAIASFEAHEPLWNVKPLCFQALSNNAVASAHKACTACAPALPSPMVRPSCPARDVLIGW